MAYPNFDLPISMLAPGEFETGRTLVDTTSVGNVRHKRGLKRRGAQRGAQRPQRGRACMPERAAFRTCLDKHTRTQVEAGEAEAGTNATTMASEGAVLAGLGTMGQPVPRRDFVPGEIESASRMIAHRQSFGLPGLGQPVPISDLVPGEYMTARTLVDHAQGFGGLGQPVPIADLARGEFERASRMIAHRQQFDLRGLGQPVPVSDLVPGEYERASRMIAHRQAFNLRGLGAAPNYDVPISDLVPGEFMTGKTLVDHAQSFGGLGQPVPISDLKKGEYERASRMIAHRQQFDLGDWIPFTKGEPEPKDGAQGTWLSPSQVPAWDRESAATLISQPQNFGGLGDNAVPRADFVEGEIESASRMLRHRQQFGGLGDWIPFTPGEPEPTDGAQGTWLSPSQVPAWDRESASKLISQHQSFGGLGQPVPISDLRRGEYYPASRMIAHRQSFNLRGLGASGDNVRVGQLNLSPICDPQTGTCISYATPQEVQSAIGAKVGGQSALIKRQAQLPAFYAHPQLGPWGVDPRAAYQYWWAQQAAMQRAATPAPLAIWGSPGFVAPTPPLTPSGIAQTAAFNPYDDSYPGAGAAVERF